METRQSRFINRTAPIRGELSPSLFNYSIHISEKLGYLYCEVPKAACSTIKADLQRLEWGRPEYQWTNFEELHVRSLSPLLAPLQIAGFTDKLNTGHWYQFAFVREPYERILSAYLDKIARPSPQRDLFLSQHAWLTLPEGETLPFDLFVKLISSQPPEQMDNHWMPQSQLLCVDSIGYDFIGKVENLAEDMATVLQALNVTVELKTDYRPHATGASNLLGEYYTAELIGLIKEKYKNDFTHFGYDPDLL